MTNLWKTKMRKSINDMTIQYCPDLHLEFKQNEICINVQPLAPRGEILILAGDIAPLHQIEDHYKFFDYVSEAFNEVYWLPGNFGQ
jgi:hypothetical protein